MQAFEFVIDDLLHDSESRYFQRVFHPNPSDRHFGRTVLHREPSSERGADDLFRHGDDLRRGFLLVPTWGIRFLIFRPFLKPITGFPAIRSFS